MKKHCPWCGKKTINPFVMLRYTHRRYYRNSFEVYTRCRICKKAITYISRKNSDSIKYYGIILWILLIGITLLLLLSAKYHSLVAYTAVLAVILVIYRLFESVILFYSGGLARFFPDSRTTEFVDADATIKLTSLKAYIHNLDVYMLKFKNPIKNVKIKEAFDDSLIPVVFYKNNKKTANASIGILQNNELVKQALKDNLEFYVLSGDREIAQGKVLKWNINEENEI